MSKELRVLLIEDSDDDAELMLRELRLGGYIPKWQRAHRADELRRVLTEQPFDIILCDYTLPELDAPQAFAVVRELKLDLPFIIVSGTIGEEKAVECIRAGVHDFILKDRLARLPYAVERELVEAALRAEQARMNEQLQRAQDALLRSEKLHALGQMAAGIAHDLTNLLSPLDARLELLEPARAAASKQSPAEARDNISQMRSIVERGVQTIQRLQGFSRQSSEATQESVALNRVAQEALALARSRMASHSHPCLLQEQLGTPPPIRGSFSELLAAVVHLIGNSLDAMPHGGTITVRTEDEKGEALLQVIDDGPGIPPEVKQHLFEPFFTTKGEAGTGLGLAMVCGTVARHGGVVSLDTEPGQGARFSLKFPAAPGVPAK